MNSRLLFTVAAFTCAAMLPAQNLAGDEALSKVLIDGESWREVGSGYGFTDAACNDAAGNFYFSDLPKATLYKVAKDGKPSVFLENGPQISGMKFGPDGRLYAATQKPKKQVIAITLPSKEISVIADNVQPNDLVVSKHGFVYFTDTGKGSVVAVEIKSGKVLTVATNLIAPNGIALSPDGGTLAVSEYRGTNVWTFRVNADGKLDGGARTMTMRMPTGQGPSAGDGMCVDAAGRYYVTSAVGIQMFDSTGRLSGVISKPQNKGIVSCGFGGEYFYVCNADKVFRRKTQAQGPWLFEGQPSQPRNVRFN
jgi:gluconolactonase